jgi:hypothetical protein
VPYDKPEKIADVLPSIADIDTKIAALQALRASLVAAHAAGALGQPSDVSTWSQSGDHAVPAAIGTPIDLPRGALLGKSVPAAIKLYLAAARQKKTTREIASALRDGGVESLASNFETTVTSALHRLRMASDVLRFDDGWALAEFYPDSFKHRMAREAKPSKGIKAGRTRATRQDAVRNGRKKSEADTKTGAV